MEAVQQHAINLSVSYEYITYYYYFDTLIDVWQ